MGPTDPWRMNREKEKHMNVFWNMRFGGKQGYKYDWCELVG